MLDNHFASKHSEELPFPCSYCTRLFPTKTARNNHHYMAHKDNSTEPNFKCDKCNIFFEMKEELRIHSFIHFNGEIRTCLDCNQIFKSNRLLKIHMQKHEATKSFQCTTCGDYFTFKTGLAKHIRMNRCKGPSGSKNDEAIAEIAKTQFSEVTKRSKKLPPKEDSIKDEPTDVESESEFEDNFEDFFDQPEPLQMDFEVYDVKEVNVETLETRGVRKKKFFEEKKQRLGRAHLIYTCDFCDEDIKYKHKIAQHMRQHVVTDRYTCRECQETFKSRKKLVDHSMELHGFKPQVVKEAFACEVCDRKFDARSIYETHKLSHDDNARNHVCSICSAAFKSVGNLRRHEAIHAPSRDFNCPNCPKSFKTQLARKIHIESVHAAVKVFVNCSFCNVIVQEKHLKTHIRNQHTEEGQEKPFSCTACFKTFKTEKLGQRHYEAVHDPKADGIVYSCPDCPDQFYRQRDLKEHSFVHFNGVIFQCETCYKMFKSRRLLSIHSAVHSDATVNFPCSLCHGVVFKTRGGRRKHMARLHSKVEELPEQNETHLIS